MIQHLQELRANARECKMLAATSLTEEARAILEELAARYESQADATGHPGIVGAGARRAFRSFQDEPFRKD